MASGYLDQFIDKGTTYSAQVQLENSVGEPYDLSNHTVQCQARRSYYSSNATITFVTSVLDASNGIIQIDASASNTALLPIGRLVYDVVVANTQSNVVSRVLEGQMFISPSVTR